MAAITTKTGKAAILIAPEDGNSMDNLVYSVLDDILHNIIEDLLLKVHRDEKMAKANTAAIRIEKLASDATDSSLLDPRPDVRIETDAAIYEEGRVVLKGNPLKTTKDILCPRCNLPRLLYPTDGKGAKKPDPGVIYCKKHPWIEKPGYDIYGQTWVPQGPGRGKKKKDMEKKPETSSPGGDGAPTTTGGGAASRPPNVLSFPSATCSKCKRCILVTRLNNHMGSCIGNSGRNASRAAAEKLKNGSSNGNGNGEGTPPSSQKGTPLPSSRAGSPRKRDPEEMEGGDNNEEDEDANPKKKLKPAPAAVAAVIKKVNAKTKGPKKEKVKTGSLLANESKPDDRNEKDSKDIKDMKESKEEERKKEKLPKSKTNSAVPPTGSSDQKENKQPKHWDQKEGKPKPSASEKEIKSHPPSIPPRATSTTPIPPPTKKKQSTSKIPSPVKKLKLNATKPPSLPASAAVAAKQKKIKDPDAGSESSGTISSPIQS